ncbi:unnamed protein product [Blepharisma stoltei]|uniref:RING-type domain-containing protein n=1 Tax=Blepharisma stoltei TaxID=1481888 RepID=A0AAU9IRM6_9CILI|nr:unnamed protein product [Blepharisma stoltei]
MNLNPFNCQECSLKFDSENRLPLVLPCGDSLCMVCAVQLCNFSSSRKMCKKCHQPYELSLQKIKDMPKNKALLDLLLLNIQIIPQAIKQRNEFILSTPTRKFQSPLSFDERHSFTPDTYSRIAFEGTPERSYIRTNLFASKDRQSKEENKEVEKISKFKVKTEEEPEIKSETPEITNENLSQKCLRENCENKKSCNEGKIFNYCSLNCYNLDKAVFS